ncbi:MFS transporter [Cryptosporangium phraense]|uniref:MFS transporter n=1 Tax=Cryptosporangium phraense TaxID=2593070 RepID=A0A545AFR6_9ACTN|nr:MFS transporter [Cryptosporangium phraense]TQS40159.1 MFS transporter [Cryptosporangium phraense]
MKASRREWLGLAVLALPTLLVSIDVFVMLLALPHLSVALNADSTQQLWIMDAYPFLLSGFLITMGAVSDRIGPRKLLLIGATAFGVTSTLAAYAPNPVLLIVARAVLGVAGATLAPSILALISAMFRDPKERGLAIGVWFVCFMGGTAIGPVVGGAMLAHFWWGSVFLLGVPAMVVLLACAPVLRPFSYAEHGDAVGGIHVAPAKIDPASVALSLAAVLPIVYGLKQLAKDGPGVTALAAIVLGLVAGTIFLRRQHRLPRPLLNLKILRDPACATALGGLFLGTLLMGAMMLFITERLQLVAGLSALRSGLWMLPAAATSAVSVVVAPLLARRVRPAYLIAGGLAISVAAQAALALLPADAGPGRIAACFALTNLGAGPLVSLATGLVLGAVPPSEAGSAGALNETSGEFGFALGIATLGSLGVAVYRATIDLPAGLTPVDAARARDTLTEAAQVAAGLPDKLGSDVLTAAHQAFTTGMQAAAAVSAALLAGLAVLVLVALRRTPPTGEKDSWTPSPQPTEPGSRSTATAADRP